MHSASHADVTVTSTWVAELDGYQPGSDYQDNAFKTAAAMRLRLQMLAAIVVPSLDQGSEIRAIVVRRSFLMLWALSC